MKIDKSNYLFGIFMISAGILLFLASIFSQDNGDKANYIIGTIFLTITGISFVVSRWIKDTNSKKLMFNGNHIKAKIKNADFNYKHTVMNKHPYVVYSVYEDVYTGKFYEFKSDDIWLEECDISIFQIDDDIDVYIKGNNLKKYYVDVEGYVARHRYI